MTENRDMIEIKYLKSSDHKTVKCDSVFGGFTPSKMLHIAIMTDKVAMPNSQIFKKKSNDNAFELEKDDFPNYPFVKENHADLIMDPQNAKSLADWIYEKLNEIGYTEG